MGFAQEVLEAHVRELAGGQRREARHVGALTVQPVRGGHQLEGGVVGQDCELCLRGQVPAVRTYAPHSGSFGSKWGAHRVIPRVEIAVAFHVGGGVRILGTHVRHRVGNVFAIKVFRGFQILLGPAVAVDAHRVVGISLIVGGHKRIRQCVGIRVICNIRAVVVGAAGRELDVHPLDVGQRLVGHAEVPGHGGHRAHGVRGGLIIIILYGWHGAFGQHQGLVQVEVMLAHVVGGHHGGVVGEGHAVGHHADQGVEALGGQQIDGSLANIHGQRAALRNAFGGAVGHGVAAVFVEQRVVASVEERLLEAFVGVVAVNGDDQCEHLSHRRGTVRGSIIIRDGHKAALRKRRGHEANQQN